MWVTAAWLKEWILSEALIEDIFGARLDVRVVVRSGRMLTFMANHQGIGMHHLEMLWKSCSSGFHESTRRAIYNCFIASIVPYLSVPLRLQMFQQFIACTSYDKWDDQFFHFLQRITIVAMEKDASCTDQEDQK